MFSYPLHYRIDRPGWRHAVPELSYVRGPFYKGGTAIAVRQPLPLLTQLLCKGARLMLFNLPETAARFHKKAPRARNAEKWRQLHPNYMREYARQRREKMAGRPRPEACEVCGDIGPVAFDHCHQRDVFRGWLCNGCNRALGFVRDDPNRLRKLIAYLERTKNVISPQLTLPGM